MKREIGTGGAETSGGRRATKNRKTAGTGRKRRADGARRYGREGNVVRIARDGMGSRDSAGGRR